MQLRVCFFVFHHQFVAVARLLLIAFYSFRQLDLDVLQTKTRPVHFQALAAQLLACNHLSIQHKLRYSRAAFDSIIGY